MLVRGRVSSGKGDLSHWMQRHRDDYERATGVRLVPGSLNVVLDEPWVIEDAAIRLDPPEYGVGMSIVPCQINGTSAFVLRTDENNAGCGDHPTTVVEVAAAIHLRSGLGLRDGDLVELVLPDYLPRINGLG